ncbi:MAG: cbb3-type cytochrome c oxidase subunit I [Actinomycetota bacterium]
MALTETRPEKDATDDAGSSPAAGAAAGTAAPATVDSIIGTGDHKTIGRLFIGAGLIGLIGGLIVGIVATFQANNFDSPAADAIDHLAQIWSLSRDLVMFGGLVPLLLGIAIYVVPLQIGAPSLAFARGAAAGLWTWFLGLGLLVLAYVFDGGPGGGDEDFIVLWAAALAMMIGGLVWAMVCVATTILGARTQGMTLERVPVTTWGFFVFSLVGIFSLPIVMGELLLAFLRVRYFHLPWDQSASLTGILDGVSLAPAVYWLGIPGLAMGADIIGVHSEEPVRAHKPVLVAIGLFGLLTYGADVVGLASIRPVDFNNGFLVVGLFACVLPILGVLGLSGQSIRTGTLNLRAALIGVLLSGLLLLLAAIVALLATVAPIMRWLDSVSPGSVDLSNSLVLNGTRFHEGLRALVVGSVIAAVIAALHHWAPKIWGRRMAEPLGFVALLATAAGSVIWAAGEIAAGFDDQPWLPARATDDFASGLAAISLIGVAVIAAGPVILGANIATSFLGSKRAGSSPNVWSGTTLEWATASPPKPGNFPAPPIVRSATPLADGDLLYVGMESEDEESGDTESGEKEESEG